MLFAAALAALLGLVGLSVDIGRLEQRKASLQRTADAAALAGALNLARVEPDVTGASLAAHYYVIQNESQIPWYHWVDDSAGSEDSNGRDVDVSFSSTNRANDTISVHVEDNLEFSFLKFLGVEEGSASATAKVVTRAATGFEFDSLDVFPYAVWGGARTAGHTNSCSYNICIGSTQVYRSNHWDSDSHVASGYDVNGNNFKGYFHAGGDVVQLNPAAWQTFSKGGNATGQQPLDALERHIASKEPIILPVVVAAECTGGCGEIKFKIAAWVALRITSLPNPSQAWTGTVVQWTSPAASSSGPVQPPANFPGVQTFALAD